MNDFKTDLEYSLEASDLDMFDNFYKRIFGKSLLKVEIVTDRVLQFRGVDKILHFASGKTLMIDEKKRRKDYGDILLEIWSNTETKTRGWVYKPFTDYICYAIMPANKCYLLPSVLLKLWVKENFAQFDTFFRKVEAKNEGYVTTSYAIPTDILLEGLKQTMQKNFT